MRASPVSVELLAEIGHRGPHEPRQIPFVLCVHGTPRVDPALVLDLPVALQNILLGHLRARGLQAQKEPVMPKSPDMSSDHVVAPGWRSSCREVRAAGTRSRWQHTSAPSTRPSSASSENGLLRKAAFGTGAPR